MVNDDGCCIDDISRNFGRRVEFTLAEITTEGFSAPSNWRQVNRLTSLSRNVTHVTNLPPNISLSTRHIAWILCYSARQIQHAKAFVFHNKIEYKNDGVVSRKLAWHLHFSPLSWGEENKSSRTRRFPSERVWNTFNSLTCSNSFIDRQGLETKEKRIKQKGGQTEGKTRRSMDLFRLDQVAGRLAK